MGRFLTAAVGVGDVSLIGELTPVDAGASTVSLALIGRARPHSASNWACLSCAVSSFIPGVGQFMNGQYLKGLGFLGAFVAVGLGTQVLKKPDSPASTLYGLLLLPIIIWAGADAYLTGYVAVAGAGG